MPECRTCGAPMEWAITARGKPIPLDPEPVENGNIEKTGEFALTRFGDEAPVVRYVDDEQPDLFEQDRFVTHFATCPDAREHRKDD